MAIFFRGAVSRFGRNDAKVASTSVEALGPLEEDVGDAFSAAEQVLGVDIPEVTAGDSSSPQPPEEEEAAAALAKGL